MTVSLVEFDFEVSWCNGRGRRSTLSLVPILSLILCLSPALSEACKLPKSPVLVGVELGKPPDAEPPTIEAVDLYRYPFYVLPCGGQGGLRVAIDRSDVRGVRLTLISGALPSGAIDEEHLLEMDPRGFALLWRDFGLLPIKAKIRLDFLYIDGSVSRPVTIAISSIGRLPHVLTTIFGVALLIWFRRRRRRRS